MRHKKMEALATYLEMALTSDLQLDIPIMLKSNQNLFTLLSQEGGHNSTSTTFRLVVL